MMDSCGKHPHEIGVALCRRCGHAWCGTCLVYSFGPQKPPYCMSCAMVAGGVKSSAALPAMSRRQIKMQMRAMRAETKAVAKATKGAAQESAAEEAACVTTDWSTPWWEDRQPAALAD